MSSKELKNKKQELYNLRLELTIGKYYKEEDMKEVNERLKKTKSEYLQILLKEKESRGKKI